MAGWQIIDYVGLIGGIIVLFAFWRIATGRWKPRSALYELDNLVGSGLLIIYAQQKHAYASIVLNVVWAIVAFRGLSSFAERRMMANPNFRGGYRKGRRAMKSR